MTGRGGATGNRTDRFQQMSEQERLIEEKKRQILNRLQNSRRSQAQSQNEESKAEKQEKKSSDRLSSSPGVTGAAELKPKANVFTNDGSFLDQFQKFAGQNKKEIESIQMSRERSRSPHRLGSQMQSQGQPHMQPYDQIQPHSRMQSPNQMQHHNQMQPHHQVQLPNQMHPHHHMQPHHQMHPHNQMRPHTQMQHHNPWGDYPPVPPPPLCPQSIPAPSPLVPQTIPPPRPMDVPSIPPPDPLAVHRIPPPPRPPAGFPPPHFFQAIPPPLPPPIPQYQPPQPIPVPAPDINRSLPGPAVSKMKEEPLEEPYARNWMKHEEQSDQYSSDSENDWEADDKVEVKREIKEEVRREIKEEVKQEIKEAVKQEIKEGVKLEIKEGVGPEMKQDVKVELKQEIKEEGASSSSTIKTENNEKSQSEREKRRRSRWGEKAQDVPPPVVATTVPKISVTGMSGHLLTKVTRTEPGLLQYAMQAYGSANLSEEDWKKAEDNYKVHLLYQDMLSKRAEVEKLHNKGKHKYEYDSDEETEGGTWEHKVREKEMLATQNWADSLTEMAKGKHHIGDFLPPDELKRFMDKYSALKGGKEPDLSDYKEYKLTEENKGFQMLQKLGWTEGKGLGSDGGGIVEPINKAKIRDTNQGLGVINPGDVDGDDDEYAAYRKRMMLAYRFRPNPLNNPRRPYY